MSLERAIADAYERAQTSLDPTDWRVYHALNAALHAERAKRHEPGDTSGLRTAEEAGYVSEINIPPGEGHN
jgi:hypothetical protein